MHRPPRASLPLAAVLLALGPASASAKPIERDPGISEDQVQAIEKELMAEMPELAPIGDPKRVEQLWTLAKRLTAKRAFCRAVEYLEKIETNTGEEITVNEGAAAQAFFMCGRTRLGQGEIRESERMLARAKKLVRNRPEYRDLEFKLALVHAREQIETGDVVAMRHHVTEARQLGVDMGPGRGDKLADWAIPVFYDTLSEISAWSYELLQEEPPRLELADQASKLVIEFYPRDKIANQVQREIGLSRAVVPVGIGVGMAILAVILWQVIRRMRVKSAAQAGILDDDYDDGLDDLDDAPVDDGAGATDGDRDAAT